MGKGKEFPLDIRQVTQELARNNICMYTYWNGVAVGCSCCSSCGVARVAGSAGVA